MGAFAHSFRVRFWKFSVKVVRHRNGKYFCGRLWKRFAVGVRGSHPSKTAKGGASNVW